MYSLLSQWKADSDSDSFQQKLCGKKKELLYSRKAGFNDDFKTLLPLSDTKKMKNSWDQYFLLTQLYESQLKRWNTKWSIGTGQFLDGEFHKPNECLNIYTASLTKF